MPQNLQRELLAFAPQTFVGVLDIVTGHFCISSPHSKKFGRRIIFKHSDWFVKITLIDFESVNFGGFLMGGRA